MKTILTIELKYSQGLKLFYQLFFCEFDHTTHLGATEKTVL